MRPAVLLPREDNPVARGPKQLALGNHRVEGAARAVAGGPDLPPDAVAHRGYVDGPAAAFTAAASTSCAGGGPKKRYLFTVRRPNRVAVAVHRGVEILKLPGVEIVHRDEAVIAAVADKCQFAAVGRPCGFRRSHAGADMIQGRRLIAGGDPDLPAVDERHAIAFGGEGRPVSVCHLVRLAAGRHLPHGLLYAIGIGAGVRIGPAGKFQVAAAGVVDALGVGRPMQFAEILPVILGVRCDANALPVRRGGHPDIARAALVQQPRHLLAAGSRHQFGRKRRGEYLLQRERSGERQ